MNPCDLSWRALCLLEPLCLTVSRHECWWHLCSCSRWCRQGTLRSQSRVGVSSADHAHRETNTCLDWDFIIAVKIFIELTHELIWDKTRHVWNLGQWLPTKNKQVNPSLPSITIDKLRTVRRAFCRRHESTSPSNFWKVARRGIDVQCRASSSDRLCRCVLRYQLGHTIVWLWRQSRPSNS